MVKIINFLFFAQKVSSGMGASHSKFLGGQRPAALEPRKEGVHFVFFVFNRKRKWKKYFEHFVGFFQVF